jgi:hypothetical protein
LADEMMIEGTPAEKMPAKSGLIDHVDAEQNDAEQNDAEQNDAEQNRAGRELDVSFARFARPSSNS